MSGVHMDRDVAGGAGPGRAAPRLAGVNVHAVLTTIFNCFALNGLLVIACLPVVTIPVALWAAVVTLGRWRDEGEPAVAREFLVSLRDARARHVTATVGVPALAAGLAAVEVASCLRGGSPPTWICLGLGVAAAFICVAGTGFSVVLCVCCPDMRPSEVWSAAATLAVRNALGAGLLLVGEAALLVLVLGRDPALCVVCVPLAFVAGLRATAARPVARLATAERELSTTESEEGSAR